MRPGTGRPAYECKTRRTGCRGGKATRFARNFADLHPHRAATGGAKTACTPRDWLNQAWTRKQGAVYKWLKGDSFSPPMTFLVRPKGTPTANLREMDSLLQDAWRTINRKYAQAAGLDPLEFLLWYGHHVRWVPMI